MNRTFNDTEINILWDMFISDYPGASRSTKSQVTKKWKTGTYGNAVNANAIVVKYFNQLELKQKEEDFWEAADEKTKELDQEYHDLGLARAKLAGEQATMDRNKKVILNRTKSNEEKQQIITMMRSKLKEYMSDFEYASWVDTNFNRDYVSSHGL